MSHNQPRGEKSEAQYRKPARSGNPNPAHSRSFYGAGGKGGGSASAPAPAPSPSGPSSASLSSNRSFKKSGHNGQGGQQFKGGAVGVRSEHNASVPPLSHVVQNGSHVQPPPHGMADATVHNTAKQIDASAAKIVRAVPTAKQAQTSSAAASEASIPAMPPKGDASKPVALQFGTINAGLMNGVQIPARTSSAPPNLDEQKRDQVRHEPFKVVTSAPIPTAPKHQQRKKDATGVDQSITVEPYPPTPASNSQAAFTSTGSTVQKPSALAMAATSVPMPFSQHPIPVQYTGPSAPIQTPGITPNTLQMPMPMPIGNAPQVQTQFFVPSLQPHHPLQAQSMVHQGQGIGYPPQMGHQLAPQMGNLGMGIGSQYPSQPGKFNTPTVRKNSVKITHPETNEEVRLDKRTDSYVDSGQPGKRFPSNVPPQSQPVASFSPAQSINSYGSLQPSSYSSAVYFQTHTSVPPANPQMNTVPPVARFNYPVVQGVQTGTFIKSSAQSSVPISISGPPVSGTTDNPRTENLTISISPPTTSAQVTVKLPIISRSDKGNIPVAASASHNKVESPKSLKPSVEIISAQQLKPEGEHHKSLGTEETVSVTNNNDSLWVTLRRSDSIDDQRADSMKDQQKEIGDKEVKLSQQHQADQNEHGLSLKSSSVTPEKCSNITDDISEEFVKKDVSLDMLGLSLVEPTVTSLDISIVPSRKAAEESEDYQAGNLDKSENVPTRIQVGGDNSNELLKAPALDLVTESELKSSVSSEIDCGNASSEMTNTVFSSHAVKHQAKFLKSQVDANKNTHISDSSSATEIGQDVTGSDSTLQKADSIVDAERFSDSIEPESASCKVFSSGDAEAKVDEALPTNKSLMEGDRHEYTQDVSVKETSVSSLSSSEACKKPDSQDMEKTSGATPVSVSVSKDRVSVEQSRPKSSAGRKKKKKELLMKADAAGATFDLYNAYKGPEEKQPEVVTATSEIVDRSINLDVNPNRPEKKNLVPNEDCLNKDEVDDWEDAEISTPTLKNEEKGHYMVNPDKHLDGVGKKKYSRDFLLILKEQFLELPTGFRIATDIADPLMGGKVSTAHLVDRNSYPSTARIIDRPSGASRNDRRGSNIADDDKWNKSQAPLMSGRNGGGSNFRPGQGGNHGVLRNPRVGGILAGPMQSLTPQGSLSRNSSDSDRWQRGTGLQKGLMPSPQTPTPRMHKADNRYLINRSVDEEEGKQRKLKGILNKLTPQNFEKLFEQVKDVNIDNATTLIGVISQIFDKALMEPTFCEMYANFCFHLSGELPDFNENDQKITFKRVLLDKCQEEFERGEREQAEANKVEEGEVQQSEEEREEKRVKARRKMLGNIRLIGELYKKSMLTQRIMHECINKLLGQDGSGQYQTPDEEDVEALCKLMSTIGEMIDQPKAKDHMDAYFDMMLKLSMNQNLSSRVRFMLKDAIDLRKNRWQQRRKVEGPKKIDEVHRDAAQERQLQASRLSRGPSMGSSSRRGQPPMDYGPRGSAMLPSPVSQQMGGSRNLTGPSRGFGTQDVRLEDRQPFESRTMSIPLPQRSIDDDLILLGPQGGLGRGMSIRGQHSSTSSAPLNDVLPSGGDQRRFGPGPNGYGHGPDWQQHRAQEEVVPRSNADRLTTQSGPGIIRDRNQLVLDKDSRNLDRTFDRSTGANMVPEAGFSEDKLRDMSVAAIREYYSARNEEEVRLCVKDLNSPGFYPDMIMLWVVDSFDRKNNNDRELLAKLLVNLCKSHDGLLSTIQLIRGFESVVSTLEDTVTDSPRATEYLGRIFGKIILEDVIPISEVGRLLLNGGDEPGSLCHGGLASDVIVGIVEMIRGEKGDSGLKEILASSNFRLEDFRPQDPVKSQRLETLIPIKWQ